MEEMLKKVLEDLMAQDGGNFGFSYEPTNSEDGRWLAAYEFGKEADDSDMVGGASYQVGATAEEALRKVVEECHL